MLITDRKELIRLKMTYGPFDGKAIAFVQSTEFYNNIRVNRICVLIKRKKPESEFQSYEENDSYQRYRTVLLEEIEIEIVISKKKWWHKLFGLKHVNN